MNEQFHVKISLVEFFNFFNLFINKIVFVLDYLVFEICYVQRSLGTSRKTSTRLHKRRNSKLLFRS